MYLDMQYDFSLFLPAGPSLYRRPLRGGRNAAEQPAPTRAEVLRCAR